VKFQQKFSAKAADGDMTAMIDMVFQLIIFFMVLINFSQDDQNDKIKLPSSELAKPAEAPLKFPILVQDLIKKCQELGFEQFVLRVKEDSSI